MMLRHLLRDNLGEQVVAKLRNNEPITPNDEADLQRLLVVLGRDVGDGSLNA